ncbi:hypothetical protein [Desulfovibrio porci]
MARIAAMTVQEAEDWYAAFYPERMAALRKTGQGKRVHSLRAQRKKHV